MHQPRPSLFSSEIRNPATKAMTTTSPQPKLRTSCDPCSISKVRCTKETSGCARCLQNGLECVYGRSQRRGKPPSNKNNGVTENPLPHQPLLSSHAPPLPSSLPSLDHSAWSNGQYEHNANYNYNCPWSRSPMFPTIDYTTPSHEDGLPTDCHKTAEGPTIYQSLPNEDTGASHWSFHPDVVSWSNLAGSNSTSTDCNVPDSLTEELAHQEYDHFHTNKIGEIDDNHNGHHGVYANAMIPGM